MPRMSTRSIADLPRQRSFDELGTPLHEVVFCVLDLETTGGNRNEDMITEYNAQHRSILDAIRAREPEQAASMMKTHLEAARVSLMRVAEA